jgi:hypothetical protein
MACSSVKTRLSLHVKTAYAGNKYTYDIAS